jgi:hypothetical protein
MHDFSAAAADCWMVCYFPLCANAARRCIYRYGMVTAVRVCQACAESIDETHRMDAILWKDLRISAYLRNKLIPYFNPAVDRGIDKVFR